MSALLAVWEQHDSAEEDSESVHLAISISKSCLVKREVRDRECTYRGDSDGRFR